MINLTTVVIHLIVWSLCPRLVLGIGELETEMTKGVFVPSIFAVMLEQEQDNLKGELRPASNIEGVEEQRRRKSPNQMS